MLTVNQAAFLASVLPILSSERDQDLEWVEHTRGHAPKHLHPQFDQGRWVETLSQNDAGWLLLFESTNRRSTCEPNLE